jgi:alkylation response protein AidB-like acyl-CoA dehydrogenase
MNRRTARKADTTTTLDVEESLLVETVRDSSIKTSSPRSARSRTRTNTSVAWNEQMKRIGIYGLAIPAEYGGAPVSMPCYVDVTQELARGWMSLAGAMGGHTVVAKLITLFGTEIQKRTYRLRWRPVSCGPQWH